MSYELNGMEKTIGHCITITAIVVCLNIVTGLINVKKYFELRDVYVTDTVCEICSKKGDRLKITNSNGDYCYSCQDCMYRALELYKAEEDKK